QSLFAFGSEAEELQRVFTHVGVGAQRDLGSRVAQIVKRRKRDGQLIADAADVYDHGVGLFLNQFAGDVRDQNLLLAAYWLRMLHFVSWMENPVYEASRSSVNLRVIPLQTIKLTAPTALSYRCRLRATYGLKERRRRQCRPLAVKSRQHENREGFRINDESSLDLFAVPE